MTNNEFKIIAHGVDIEQTEGRSEVEERRTESWVVWFPPDALDEWQVSRPIETGDWACEYASLDEAESARLEHKRRRDALVERVKDALGICGYAEVVQTMHEIFTVVHISHMTVSAEHSRKTVVHRVNPLTLTDFMRYLRLHGWPVSLEKAKGMIEAGIFEPAAIAFQKQTQEYQGGIAQIIQHECDHMEGIII